MLLKKGQEPFLPLFIELSCPIVFCKKMPYIFAVLIYGLLICFYLAFTVCFNDLNVERLNTCLIVWLRDATDIILFDTI